MHYYPPHEFDDAKRPPQGRSHPPQGTEAAPLYSMLIDGQGGAG